MEGLSYNPEENDKTEIDKIPDNYDAAIVLGEMLEEDEHGQPKLTMQAKMRIMASGLLAQNGKIKEIIFSGGQTSGEDFPPEAEEMEAYFRRTFPDLTDFPTYKEDQSFDTSENAINSKDILEEHHLENAFVITAGHRLKRAQKLFADEGLATYPLGAEEMTRLRSPHHDAFVDKYLGSKVHYEDNLKELLIRSAMIVDRKSKILRLIARKNRHG